MTRNDLFLCMDAVDDDVLARSDKTTRVETHQKRRNGWRIVAAACFCLIVGIGAWGLFGSRAAPAAPGSTEAHMQVQMRKVPADPSVYAGSNQIAAIQAENEIYLIDWVPEAGADGTMNWYIMAGEPQDDWETVGTIQSVAASRWELTGNLQSNCEEYLGCELCRDPDLPGELWVKHDGRYEHFLSEKYLNGWIFHDGKLYLYCDAYWTVKGIIPESFDTSVLPEDARELGLLHYNPDKRLPDTELELTHGAEWDAYRVYYSESLDCLLMEVPNGAYAGKTVYWRFYPCNPDDFLKQPAS